MNIRTNVKKEVYDIVVEVPETKHKTVLHIKAESLDAARMLVPKSYRIVEPDEEV